MAIRTLRITLYSLTTLLITASLLWLVYHDKTTPPRLGASTFANRSLENALQTIANATVEGGAPGVVLLVRKQGKDYVATAGVANKATQQGMPENAVLRIGSISKVYTATVILTLAEQGKLDLDKPISHYLEKKLIAGVDNAERATLRQLLMHTAGVPDYYDIRSYLGQDWTQPITLERTLPVAKRGSADFIAGERFEYSNMGYVYLGAIAERVSGKPMAELVEQMINRPLGLTSTYYNVQHPQNAVIHGYGTILRPWADTYDYWEHSGPDGGIVASASDTARFLAALTLENGALRDIGKTMLETLIPSESKQQQGLGLHLIQGKDGRRLIGHTGDVFGYQTVAFAIPEISTVFVAQVNCDCKRLTSSLVTNIYKAMRAQPASKTSTAIQTTN